MSDNKTVRLSGVVLAIALCIVLLAVHRERLNVVLRAGTLVVISALVVLGAFIVSSSESPQEVLYLDEITSQGTGLRSRVWNISGSGRYPHGLAADNVGCEVNSDMVTYHLDQLDGSYSRFETAIGVTPDTNEVARVAVSVQADNRVVKEWTSLDEPGSMNVDITGVDELTIRFEASDDQDNCIHDGYAVLGDPRLVR